MSDEFDSALDALSTLLDPLGAPRKNVIMGWVRKEMRTRAIVRYVYERGAPIVAARDENGIAIPGQTEGGPNVWSIGHKSPLNDAETILAMFLDPESRSVAVYTFTLTEVEGGAQAIHFFRADLFDLIHVHGPVHHDALVSELGSFLTDEDELDKVERQLDAAAPNGAPS